MIQTLTQKTLKN